MSGGYSGSSMSNRALNAYTNGRRPLSRLRIMDLSNAGWTETLAFAKWLAKQGDWEPSEWHHTSKEFTITDFYNPVELVDWWAELDGKEKAALLEKYSQSRAKRVAEVRVSGTYTEWLGTRRHPKPVERQFTGVKRGDWIYLDGGGRKKATGNYIRFRRISD